MKKIIFVAATLGGGGAERVMLNLANTAVEKGCEVVVIRTAQSGNTKMDYLIAPEIKLENINCNYSKKVLRIIYKLRHIRKIIKKYKDYTVISFLPDVNIYSILACVGLKNKVIVSERNDPNKEPGSSFVRKVRDVVYKYADYIVFQTYDAQKYFCEKIQKKSCIIPNPINISQLPPIQSKRNVRDVIIMVCRIKPQKNVGMLIDAINEIKDKLGNTTVELYGDGSLYRDRMKEKTKEYGLEDIIKFMGPSKDVYNIMNNAKIYISTSDYEGISNTMLEALAIGTPCIVTDCPIGGAKMFIQNGVNGILVPVGDYKRLGKEIIKLLSDEKLCEEFSNNSVKIREQLDLNIITDKWLDLV